MQKKIKRIFIVLNFKSNHIEIYLNKESDTKKVSLLEVQDEKEARLGEFIEHQDQYWDFDFPIYSFIPLRERMNSKNEVIFPYLIPIISEKKLFQGKWINLFEINEFIELHGSIICETLSLFWSDFSKLSFKVLEDFQSKEIPIQRIENPIFYGGSFNPLHEGHKECIFQVSHKGNIIVIPDRNPFKKNENSQCPWKYYQYLRDELKDLNCLIYPGFCGLDHSNPSYRWLEQYNTPCSLLMGDDSFISLPSWINSERVIKAVNRIYVVPRENNQDKIRASLEWIRLYQVDLEIEFLREHQYQNISSTQLRKKVKL